MTRGEVKSVMQTIEAAYGRQRFAISQAVFNAWCDATLDLDYAITCEAVTRYIRDSEFVPTIAGIRKYYGDILAERESLRREIREIYDIITGLLGGGCEEAWREYVGLLSLAKRKAVAARWVLKQAKAAGDGKDSTMFFRGLADEQRSRG